MSSHHPGKIIGSRGWLVRLSSDGEIHYGENWTRASFGDFGRDLLMPGGNGCLYPWGSLHPEVDDVETALRICPTADDIWFWSAALKNKSEFFCLGFPPHRPITAQKKAGTLSSINSTENDSQFQSAINQFGIRGVIRESIDQRQLDQDA